jgi:hypothetical protein
MNTSETERQTHRQALAADLVPLEMSKRGFEFRPPPVSHEQLAAMDSVRPAIIPEGWVFYSADFSHHAADAKKPGTVMLKRDWQGTRKWLCSTPEERVGMPLFVNGAGMSVNAATVDAVAKIAGVVS